VKRKFCISTELNCYKRQRDSLNAGSTVLQLAGLDSILECTKNPKFTVLLHQSCIIDICKCLLFGCFYICWFQFYL